MKWLQTTSNVGALWATSTRSLFSFVYQNFTSIYLDFFLYEPIAHHNQWWQHVDLIIERNDGTP
jgi:hypothetical protein